MRSLSLLRLTVAGAALAVLGACTQGPYGQQLSPDVQRAAGGAIAGGVIAKALDEDVATGAAIGGIGGALCDDLGVCQRRY
ncbi:hypothetical protein GI374_06305 [Paracoccus sp. S-4012]|uniref:hypothetical protein n=1 Tax=Paracoccus sp. S-4012 TaxID=2665648 RepID=UPI0012B146A5|nr:hypothetical protein [Paracoccus sp. S-4012]MRX50070.1 hypothetical protein [Paracoccus sp. S-4012]